MSQIRRKALSMASGRGCPSRHSTSTTDGTRGGHEPSARSTKRLEERDGFARALRETGDAARIESSTSTAAPAGLVTGPAANLSSDGAGPGALPSSGLSDLRDQIGEVLLALGE
jgi:hypothetical protein